MRLLLVDNDFGARSHHSRILSDETCTIVPVQWVSQVRGLEPEELDGIVLSTSLRLNLFCAVVDLSSRNNLPLILVGPLHEKPLRHALRKNPLVVHYPPERAKRLNAKELRAAVLAAREGHHRPTARMVIGEPTLAAVVRSILQSQNYQARNVTTLSAARHAASKGATPDLLVVDLFLSDGNGLSLLPTRPPRRAPPTIVLTPSSESWIAEEARRRGAHALVPVPLDLSELKYHVSTLKHITEPRPAPAL